MPLLNSSLECLPRFSTPRTDRATFGGNVAEVAAALGTPLMPWQQHVVDVALEVDGDGRFVYDQVVLTVPRQAGKTTLILALMTWRALGCVERQHITYAAQSGVAARDKLLDEYWPVLQASALGELFTVRKTSGHEAFMAKTGSRLTITAATEKAGHGGSLDFPVIDEAFAYTDARLEQALLPAMRARRRFLPGPQLWVVSTAGNAGSTYLRGKVDAGRQSVADMSLSGTAYFEWSADIDDDPADPATWWSCIPSLGHTVDEAAIRAEFETYTDINEWRRAGLNQWVSGAADPVFPAEVWADLGDVDSQISGEMVFGLDIPRDRSEAVIACAGVRADGLYHVEVVDQRNGAKWVIERVKELQAKWGGQLVLDSGSSAGSLIPDLEAAGVNLHLMSTRDVARACGLFRDCVMDSQLRHIDQAPLNEAVNGAALRDLGDQQAWNRRSATSNISPLIAATNALYGVQLQGAVSGEPEVYFI